MGLLIYPFLLGAVMFFIASSLLVIKPFASRLIGIREVLIGIGISIVVYLVLYLDYRFSDAAYVLGTYFIFPFFMVYVPFVIAVICKFSGSKYKTAAYAFFISIICSGLFIFFFRNFTFEIIDYLDIPKKY